MSLRVPSARSAQQGFQHEQTGGGASHPQEMLPSQIPLGDGTEEYGGASEPTEGGGRQRANKKGTDRRRKVTQCCLPD